MQRERQLSKAEYLQAYLRAAQTAIVIVETSGFVPAPGYN
jgi:hypothetical protein